MESEYDEAEMKQDELISGKQDEGKFWFSCGSASNRFDSRPGS